jgi:hypothetical protein
VVIPRYSLLLPILRPILLIWGLFGLLKIHNGHLGTQDQYLSVCMCSPSRYLLIPSHLRLKTLRFLVIITRYNFLLPILRLIWRIYGLLKTHEGPLGTPNHFFFKFSCVVLVVFYLFHTYFTISCSTIHKKINIATG